MRLNFSAMSFVKSFATTLSLTTMCVGPLAQGAAAERSNKELINQYLKETGLASQNITVGQYWNRVKQVYPEPLKKQMGPWMESHKNELMPQIQASTFKDAEGKEQVRLLFTKGSESHTITFTGNEDKPVKWDNSNLSKEDLIWKNFAAMAAKVVRENPQFHNQQVGNNSKSEDKMSNVKSDSAKAGQAKNAVVKTKGALSGAEITKLPLRQQMDYLLKMSSAVEAADKVFEAVQKSKKSVFFEVDSSNSAAVVLWKMLLGSDVSAKGKKVPKGKASKGAYSNVTNDGQSCIAAGWVAAYSKRSCAHVEDGQNALLIAVNQLENKPFNRETTRAIKDCVTKSHGLPCNPLLFGFDSSNSKSGTPFCITGSSSTLAKATASCSEKAPLDEAGKQRIINSIVNSMGDKKDLCSITKKDSGDTISRDCMSDLSTYMDGLKDHYSRAAQFCISVTDMQQPSSMDFLKANPSKEFWESHQRKDIPKDQIDACNNLKDRYFELQVEAETEKKCAANSHDRGDGTCVCNDNFKAQTTPPAVPEISATTPDAPKKSIPPKTTDSSLVCIPADLPNTQKVDSTPSPTPKDKECAFIGLSCTTWGIIGVGAAVFGLVWWLTSDKKKSNPPVFTPPAPPPLPGKTPVTPVDPVPPSPCPVPNKLVNNVCTPPSVVQPPVTTNEGGTSAAPTGAGGIR